MSSLNAQVGLRIGPLLIETLFKHYVERQTVTRDSQAREELLFDAAFTAFKTFLEAATKHSVEELQQFSNVRIPAPPWVHCVRLRIPLSCCNDAASYLIAAMGGEEATRAFTGGVKWWQARGVQGIDAQWICSKKDLEAGEKKLKETRKEASETADGPVGEEPVYSSGMDGMRCMLFMHGGGYYFGSIDQERYCMQRYARKMKGRLFAIDYRLAPQYPFPCAIQDGIAAYLYLIRPPEGVSHAPIPPNRILLAGDSAGGGLVLAMLQIIRDTNLPMPGGAVLISPWADLTHSFPSVVENTATDILPAYGLSIHKPSTLWPPPPEDLNVRVRDKLKQRIRGLVRPHQHGTSSYRSKSGSTSHFTNSEEGDSSSQQELTSRGDTKLPPDPSEGGSDAPLHPTLDESAADGEKQPGPEEPPGKPLSTAEPSKAGPITLEVDGKEVVIRSQIQLYATNHQLTHPFVSPVLGYLGGLCPLMVIASDKEVLRDEIIYIAHKAARPHLYPLKDETRALYPHLKGIESKYGPTQVHLQVYDDTSHVLPLFSFTTPAKYCYRAIAAFCVHTTPSGITVSGSQESTLQTGLSPTKTGPSGFRAARPHMLSVDTRTRVEGGKRILDSPLATTPEEEPSSWLRPNGKSRAAETSAVEDADGQPPSPTVDDTPGTRTPARVKYNIPNVPALGKRDTLAGARPKLGALVDKTGKSSRSFSFPGHFLASRSLPNVKMQPGEQANGAPHRAKEASREASEDVAGPRFGPATEEDTDARKAGDASVYSPAEGSPFEDNMIRERVSRSGVIRPLEPPDQLPGLNLPVEEIGVIKENAAKRYLHGQALWDKRFSSTVKAVEKDRIKHLKHARRDAEKSSGSRNVNVAEREKEGSWSWGWALDGEDPPPTSIVARRDTGEARRLAKIADREGDDKWGGNRLWTQLADWLTGPQLDKAADGDPDVESPPAGLTRRLTTATGNNTEHKGGIGLLRRLTRRSKDDSGYRSS